MEGDWEDKNEFNKILPNGGVMSVATDGETTFEDDGDWKSSGKLTITINGQEFRFRQKSSGTWEKKDNELEIITDDGTLTPLNPSPTAAEIKKLLENAATGKEYEYEIISLDEKRMVLRGEEGETYIYTRDD